VHPPPLRTPRASFGDDSLSLSGNRSTNEFGGSDFDGTQEQGHAQYVHNHGCGKKRLEFPGNEDAMDFAKRLQSIGM